MILNECFKILNKCRISCQTATSASSPDQTTKPSLQYGMVRMLDPLLDKTKFCSVLAYGHGKARKR
jgi:hypothetical protein